MRAPRHKAPSFGDLPRPPVCFICGRPDGRLAYLDEVVQQKIALCAGCRELAVRAGLMEHGDVFTFERAVAAMEAFRPGSRRRPGPKRRE